MGGRSGQRSNTDECSCGGAGANVTAALLDLVAKISDLITKITEQSTKMSEQSAVISKLQSEVVELKSKQSTLLSRIEDVEDSRDDWVKKNGKQDHATGSIADVSALTVKVADELSERKAREMNVVVYGMEELSDSETDASEDEEKEAVTKVITEALKVQHPQLSRAFRLGRRQTNRPRPLKVVFSDGGKRQETLEAAKSLGRYPVGHRLRNVFIRPDWSKMQREQDYARRQAAKRTREGDPQGRDEASANSLPQ